MDKEQEEILKTAIKTYGEAMQVVVCMEECAELIEALNDDLVFIGDRSTMDLIQRAARRIKKLCKMLRVENGVSCISHIADRHVNEESGDVWVMLKQMGYIFDPTDEKIKNVVSAKINRLAERMKGAE